jgi:hypothetical protein
MSQAPAMLVPPKEIPPRISVSLPAEIYHEITARAEEHNMSLNRTIIQLLRSGLEAESQKQQKLTQMLRQYRECPDQNEAERLADELGAMIFGREVKPMGRTPSGGQAPPECTPDGS